MKKIILISSIIMISLFSIFAKEKEFKSLTNEQFKSEILKENVVCVDVRTAKEYSEGHIKGVKFNIDLLSKTFLDNAISKLDKTKTIAVYCRSGHRSKKAATILCKNGFKVIGILDSKYSDLEKFVIESASESDLLNKGFLTIDTFEPSNEELSSFSEVVTQSTPPFMFTRDSNLYTFLSIFILNYILLLTYFLTERKHEIKLRHIFGHSKWITSIDFTLKFSVFATLGLTMSYIMSYILDVDINTYLFISSVALIFISTFIINYIFLIREERSL